MKWFSNIKIAYKIVIGFIAVSLLAGCIVGGVGLVNINAVNANSEKVYNDIVIPIKDATLLDYNFQTTRTLSRDILLHAGTPAMNTDISGLQSALITVNGKYASLSTEISDSVALTNLNFFKYNFDKYAECMNGIIDLAKQQNTENALAKLKSAESYASQATMAIIDLDNRLDTLAKNMEAANKKTASASTLLVGGIALAAVIAAAGLGILIASAVSRPLKKLVKVANRLSYGDTDVKIAIDSKDEVGVLAKAFQSVIDSINQLIVDTNTLVEGAQAGKFDVRADESRHLGDYLKIIEGVNRTLDVVVNKVVWYEALLDAVPMPLFATDLDMNWTFINRAVEVFLGVKRADVLGKQCSGWNAEICNTENCSIARLKSGFAQTLFEDRNKNLQANVSCVIDAKGEKAGYMEVVQDVTARTRTNFYLRGEVKKLSAALNELAQGNLNHEYAVGEGDEYTASERESFLKIGENLSLAVSTLRGYVSDISDTLHRMASGDISMPGVDAYKGDFSGISESLNIIAESFNKVLGDINSTAEQVASGTRQVSDGSQALSQGATEQAGAIEELTTSLADIAGQTKQNAEKAGQASELAASARVDALDGDARMKELQLAMTEINEASANISKIIKVIDDIAFQTNLLALNAAVEAARAGQHGKGFAVVAEEVRNLAQRSANAAKETTAMIEGSIKKTKAGTKIANDTAQALNRIVGSVEKAAGLVGGIAQASSEQAMAVSQVNKGVEQVSQVTQSNSATAEQSAAASEELSGQAMMLKEMVGRFSLRNMAGGPAKNASRPAAPQTAPKDAKPAPGKPRITLNDSEFGKY